MTQQLITTFVTVFLAGLGDKTQIATFSFAANPNYNRWIVLIGAYSALFSGLAYSPCGNERPPAFPPMTQDRILCCEFIVG